MNKNDLTNMLDLISDSAIITDNQGKVILLNVRVEQLCSINAKDVLGQDLSKVLDIRPEGSDLRAKDLLDRVSQNASTVHWQEQVKLYSNSGVQCPVSVSATPIDLENEPGIVIIIKDLSKKEKARVVLDDNMKMYRSFYNLFRMMADNSKDLLWAKDLNNHYIFTNKAMCDVLLNAKDTQEPVGRGDLFFAQRERERHADNPEWHTFGEICADTDEVVLREKKAMQFDEYGNVKGKFLFLDVHKAPIRDENGVIIGVVGTGRDVTEIKKVEKALHESEEKYRMVVETSHDIILIHDEKGIITFINQAGLNFGSYQVEDIVGKSVAEIIPIDNHEEMNIRKEKRLAGNRELFHFTTKFLSKNGDSIFMDVQSNPLMLKDQFKGAIVVARDITARKKAEEEMIKVQKLETIGNLAGGIAHDFNNILTALFGNISMAKADLTPEQPGFRFLENAVKAMTRATNLTQQLSTFSREGKPVREQTRLDQLIYEIAVFDLSGSNVKLDWSVAQGLQQACVDQGQIQQAISNLVLNAREAMPRGGTIRINIKNSVIKPGELSALAEGKYISISVRDEGEGIESQYLDRIFDPYFSTKQRGSGLGLATCYSIVNKHNGHIEVESTPGKGSTFTVYLPVSESPTARNFPVNDVYTESKIYGSRVLIMDDDEMIREILSDMLTTLGMSVDISKDAEQAISMYQQSLAQKEGYAMAILDLTIPGGIGGKEAAREILKLDPEARLLLSSGYASDLILSDYADYGFSGVVAKPFTLDKLQKAVEQVLGG